MKKLILFAALFIACLSLSAQKIALDGGVTRAVVVGISDYQDKDIPDLQFAHRDAEAFANFLRTPAGGSLDGDHLKVLLNSEATMAQFAIALDWLVENSKEGDNALVYFSGHGDVEKKTITQPGFLLCWDAPARVYMSGGAFGLSYLQEVISTLSIQNKAKVVVITDACRSGTLAGQSIGGAQATAGNLAKQYANEIKILSCQPNEYSIEGEQWGGGRGAFSFNLVDALYGLADQNNDLFVTLQEVGRYLEDRVTAEVAPISQVPMVIGNRTERLATVNPNLLANLRSGKTNQMAMLSPVESRGMEDDVLASVDTTTRELYRLFKKALKYKVFLEPAGACAEAYYGRLMAEPKLQRLHTTMTRNYAAALQDDAQQTLNEWLTTSQDDALQVSIDARLPRKVFNEKVRSYPRCLDRAAELLGEKHYMYKALKARKFFFEGYLLAKSNRNPDHELGERAQRLFRQSLVWQSEQPHVYWQMSLVFANNFRQPDSLERYAYRAMELHPNWIQPCLDAASVLGQVIFYQPERARPFLERATQIDSSTAEVWSEWGLYYLGKDSLNAAERMLKKSLEKDSTVDNCWAKLGYFYVGVSRFAEGEWAIRKAIALDSTFATHWNNLGYLCLLTRRFVEAVPILKKAVMLDSTFASAWNNLGGAYVETRRYPEAVSAFKKAVMLDSTFAGAWSNLGNLYLQIRCHAEAMPVLKKAIELNSTNVSAWLNLGNFYLQTRRYAEAESAFKKAIELDSTNVRAWNNLGNLYIQTRRYAEAQPVLKKAIALDSTNTTCWNNLGGIYLQTRRYAEAEPVLKKAIALDSTLANPRKHLGMVYFKTNRPEEARQNFQKALELNPNYAPAHLGLAYLLHSEGKTTEALGYLEQAFDKGSTFEQLEKDEDLAPLRALPEWKELMKKHFASPDPSERGEKE